jgi:Raf kinase inhibitor-like YbhB/YbcL family protein
MLEKIPASVGRALRRIRAGHEKLIGEQDLFASVPQTITLESPAFEDEGPIPPRFTADGDKISPPLIWRNIPPSASTLVLIVEDPDAPSVEPLVHLIAWNLPPDLGGFSEGSFKSPDHDGNVASLGRNSYLKAAYLPPDPPTGHGPHCYVFQIFAVAGELELTGHPGRKEVVSAMEGRVVAKGVLVGTYERK